MKNPAFFFSFAFLATVVLLSCQKEGLISDDQATTETFYDWNYAEEGSATYRASGKGKGKGGGKGGGCAESTFCVNTGGDLAGCQSVINCTEDANSRIIVSISSGPGDDPNDNMGLSFSFPNNCNFTGPFHGPLVINSDGSFEFYFKDLPPNQKNKYVLKTTSADAAVVGTWPDVTISYTGGRIEKDGKHDASCLGDVVMNATITISSVANRDACDGDICGS